MKFTLDASNHMSNEVYGSVILDRTEVGGEVAVLQTVLLLGLAFERSKVLIVSDP
jgi:hypothetical protein